MTTAAVAPNTRPGRRLTFREACYELRRAGRLYEEEKITGDVWLASVHRILEAFRPGSTR